MRTRLVSNKKSIARLFIDFDGTLTGLEGRQVVNSELYKSLLKDPGVKYGNAEFKPLSEMLVLLRADFSNGFHLGMKLTTHAKEFLQAALTDENIVPVIITRNRREYVNAILAFEGLTSEQLNRLIIKDVSDMMNTSHRHKYDLVAKVLKELKATEDDIYKIYDDSPKDRQEMLDAISNDIFHNNLSQAEVDAPNFLSGQCPWKQELETLQAAMSFSNVRLSSDANEPPHFGTRGSGSSLYAPASKTNSRATDQSTVVVTKPSSWCCWK